MNQPALENAFRLLRAGRIGEAAEAYDDILRADPRDFHALHGLGVARYQSGDLEEAVRLIGEALKIDPAAVEALYNRGSLLMKLNRLDEGLACLDRAVALKPDYIEALTNRGNVLVGLGRNVEALSNFDKVVELKPSFAAGWNNRGGALLNLKRYDDAYASFEKAIALKPDYPEAWKNRGSVYIAQQNFTAGLMDTERAIALESRFADAWDQRGIALVRLNRRAEAVESYDKALSLKPGTADAHFRRADALLSLRRFEDARKDYERVAELDPDHKFLHGTLAYCRLHSCDWQAFDEDRAKLWSGLCEDKPVSTPFMVLAVAAATEPSEAAQASRNTLAAAQNSAKEGFPSWPEPLWRGERYSHEKIRIAYLSGDFYDHAVSRQLVGVLEHHDRTQFETSAISFAWKDQGDLRPRLMRAVDTFIDVKEKSDSEIAKQLRQMEIDIAIDLGGYTEGARSGIVAYRPAPVQVNYLGYPGTMGAPYSDYMIADPVVLPEAEEPYYSEKIVRLPHCYLPADSKRRISAITPSRSDLGLPRSAFVFCCFNNNYKFTPAVFDVWMRLLSAIEGSVLWLLNPNPSAVRNLGREAEARGILPERLVFAPYVPADRDHLARLRSADLFLDTLPYNAHATANDALWAGVPVLTCIGYGFPGRVAASQLRAVGLSDMVTASLADYEALALKLARDPALLSALKLKLARNRNTQALFDTAAYTRDLESAYRAMWERAQQSLPPARLSVESALAAS